MSLDFRGSVPHDLIRRRQERAGSQADLATAAGVALATVCAVETGQSRGRQATWDALAAALGCAVATLRPPPAPRRPAASRVGQVPLPPPPPPLYPIPHDLIRRRQERAWSQADLAACASVRVPTLAGMEAGRVSGLSRIWARLADALGCTVAQIRPTPPPVPPARSSVRWPPPGPATPPPPPLYPIPQALITRRTAQGWSQSDLAAKSSLPVNIVARLEAGLAFGTQPQWRALAAALGCAPAVLHPAVSAVQSAREAKGWTRRQLAAAAGVKYDTVLRLETGRSGVSPDTFAALARALDCSFSALDPPPAAPDSSAATG